MRSRIKFVLLAAIPIETLNLAMAGFPIDTGFEPGTRWYVKVIGYQGLVLHYPGLLLLSHLDHAGFEKGLLRWISWMGLHTFEQFVLFLSGYFVTFLLILAAIIVPGPRIGFSDERIS